MFSYGSQAPCQCSRAAEGEPGAGQAGVRRRRCQWVPALTRGQAVVTFLMPRVWPGHLGTVGM